MLKRKFFIVLLLSFVIAGLSGCLSKEKTVINAEKKVEDQEKEKQAMAADPAEQEEQINDFVLENTKIVKIYNVSRRIHEKHQYLGPFFVVRGIDERGQKTEIWIQDMKIFEMINTD